MPKKVLVVDDEDRITNYLRIRFRSAGYDVITAADGMEALEQMAKHNPDIIILDLIMPKMDGWEFLKQLRLSGSAVPVIILSAKVSNYDKIKGLTLGADDYVEKPFSPDELLARVQAILRRLELTRQAQ
ncbi:MAG: response regulator transcription factor [Candidatus Nealsonbacteria bacterium]|nr:response regulator transcription factor [Candidatus Nealsonbacteria bacterium]